jgi:peptide/nickel transport system permease protein
MIEQINVQKPEKMNKTPTIKPKKINEFIYFASKNTKLKIGFVVVLFFLLLTFIGPLLSQYDWDAYVGPFSQAPSLKYWLGTTAYGQDVFSQFVLGLKATFLVGVIGGGIGTLIGMIVGFIGGYRGGMIDEGLNIITNIILVIPTFAILLIIAAYLRVRGILIEGVLIGLTAWPWAARAIRSQTFSLRSRDFVDLARMSGMKPLKIIFTEIAPNMMSYLLMTFILQFGGAMLIGATLDFIGLGPTNTISLGLMMNYAVLSGSLIYGVWWWFVPPGFAIMAIVGSLYIMNVGLDEVFNPKLREM